MKDRCRTLVKVAIVLVLAVTPTSTALGQEFYKGKTIRFIVGFSPGGGFDTYTRTIARHIGKHIPGNPSTIVANMTGAGSLIAANYVYNKAKPDGLTIGHFHGSVVFKQVLGDKAGKFDGRKFGWLGSPTSEWYVCALARNSGVKTADDWFNSKRPIKIGSTGLGSGSSATPRLMKAVLGLPIQVVDGYPGTAKVRLAIESGEVDGGCWGWEGFKATWARAIESGDVRVIFQAMPESHPDLKGVPLTVEYAKTDDARNLLTHAAQAYGTSARPFALPPGTAKERSHVLEKAFAATLKDPEFLAEAGNAKLEIRPVDAPTMDQIFKDLYKLQPALIARLKEIILPKQ